MSTLTSFKRWVAAAALATLTACHANSTPEESIARANDYRAKGEINAAIIELKDALQKDTRNTSARLLLAEAYLDRGRPADAEVEVRRLMGMGFDVKQTQVLMGRALSLQGNYNRVIAEVRPVPGMDAGKASEIATIRGEAFLALGQRADAAKEFNQALFEQPGYADALVGRGKLAALDNDIGDAQLLVNQALSSDPDNLRGLLLKADLLRYQNKIDEALAAYEQILAKRPANVLALSASTYLLINKGDYDQAGRRIAQIRSYGTNGGRADYLQAVIDYQTKQFTVARDSIQKALIASPDDLPTAMLGGAISYAVGSYELAERLSKRVVSAAPQAIFARQVLAMTLLKQNRASEAIGVIEPVVSTVNDPNLLVLAGDAYDQAKQYDKAAEMFARASALKPEDVGARMRVGATRLALGDTDRAIQEFQAAALLDPDDEKVSYVYVISLLRKGDLDRALATAEELSKRQPKNPLIANLRGGMQLAKGDSAAARKSFEYALSIQPDFVAPAMNLARLDLIDGKADAAKSRMQAVVANSHDNVEALVAQSDLLAAVNSPVNDIFSPLEQARKADPKAFEPRLRLARLLVGNDPKRAVEAAKEAAALEPRNSAAMDALGAAQLATGEQSAALATYVHLVEVQPGSSLGHFRLGELYLQTGNRVASIRELQKAVELDPKNRDAQVALVAIETKGGKTSDALTGARRLQRDYPKLSLGSMLEGDIWMSLKKPAQAAVAYEKGLAVNNSNLLLLRVHAALAASGRAQEGDAKVLAWLEEHPDDSYTRYYYGNYLRRIGQYKPAIDQYEKVITLDPSMAVALNDLAWLYGQVKDRRAVDTAARAYGLMPSDPTVADTYGEVLVSSGQVKEGASVLQTAAEKNPSAYDLRLRLGRAYAQLGESVKAKQQFESVVNASRDDRQRAAAAVALRKVP